MHFHCRSSSVNHAFYRGLSVKLSETVPFVAAALAPVEPSPSGNPPPPVPQTRVPYRMCRSSATKEMRRRQIRQGCVISSVRMCPTHVSDTCRGRRNADLRSEIREHQRSAPPKRWHAGRLDRVVIISLVPRSAAQLANASRRDHARSENPSARRATPFLETPHPSLRLPSVLQAQRTAA